MTEIVVRPASAEDAATIAHLANLLNQSEGLAESIFTEDLILRDGFGPNPAFSLLLAERAGEERGAHCLWWGVRSANRRARDFYAGLGAKDDDARFLELNGDAMLRLAREAETTSR